ncbi:tat pathway signal sequence [Colletotrichum graminicola]|uniref:Tat pathway signal sequence n=1 Tax=Colletotrichum graminicola (strain M1.001 / M2 / FGSC 10212) TaxID=645133 RepID=E3Q491_COLGM|nr:tat pathway signal sequence [Colletotrichum graminicola M1.001]EFQ25403.1 tat pathway signal sequence [Colletotrichum graminicola M1.001]WDK11351.1 tat pathway signal sequence [Colletotrichum graminicola]
MPKPSTIGRTTKTVGRMPVISEDGSTTAVTRPPPVGLAPPPPFRSTAPRFYGRSPTGRPIYPHPSYPPPAYSRSPCRDSIRNALGTRSSLSTRSINSIRSVSSVDSNGSPLNSGISTPKSSYNENAGLLPSTKRTGQDSLGEKRRGSKWVARRRSWYRLIILAIIVIVLTVGLSVGLTVWNRQSQPVVTAGASNDTNLFPSGSFAFNTALLEANTGCTSDSSTWRCFPDRTYSQSPNASVATFFGTISQSNSYAYQISSSSSSNPFFPQFSDETMTLVEGGSLDERLVFNFTLPKTVALSDAVTQGGRAATCDFPDMAFRATLWTRRNATTALAQSVGMTATADSADGNVRWGVWPGQIEVEQVKTGGPDCKDPAGKAVSVAAGNDRCNCLYANFDFVVEEKRRRRRA